ncbi:IS3 family transposase [Cohnella sp. CFH 77786]|uniref:IS3 family transposase n=1 Tax=Cohnella sp. CFH 77786 TaxID=2662265 RepID=UPI001C60D40C|nr:IS3 family transposase [Cohnella sp. CFH 77786]
MADQFIKRGEKATLVLRLLGLAESTYYARKKRISEQRNLECERSASGKRGRPCPGYSLTSTGQRVSDEQIKEWLLELVEGEEHVYGYKLLAQCLRNDHELILDKKKVYRLCDELGILQPQREKKIKHPRRLPKNHLITARNQLWQADIKYGYVAGKERFFFVLSIIDVFDRVVVGQYRGHVCEAKHAVQTVVTALRQRVGESGPFPVIRTDNGPQFLSTLFQDTCEAYEITHERIPPRTPNMNAYIESFHSVLEDNLFSKSVFMTFEEACAALDNYMDFYNNRRMHGSLKRMSPQRFSMWAMELEDRSAFYRAL